MKHRYDSYKPSGIDWIGEIPSHWEKCRVKQHYYLKGRIGWQGLKADEFIAEGPFLVTGTDFRNGRVDWSLCYHISEERYNEAPEIHVKTGDILITKDGTVGKLAYIEDKPEKVSLNSHLLIIRPLKPNLRNRYLYYVLGSDMFKNYTEHQQSGSIMASLSQEKIGEFSYFLPPIVEQEAIAVWLDAKCEDIDAAVAKVDREIELIDELKLSEISRVVTRGLNPDVTLRPSGIDWIGDVPEHWQIAPFKRSLTINNGCDYKHIVVDEGYPVIGSGGQFAYASDYLYDGEVLLLGRKGTIDKPMHYIGKFWTVDTMFYAVPKSNVCCRYMYYQALGFPFDYYSTATALPSMAASDLANNPIIVPPLSEQREIADYLDRRCAEIDGLKEKLKRKRETLVELRQSLISEVVTGKRKVV